MGKINLLDVEVSNKIAAGEVVERPASVVKELVENSIDAGATKITVEIKNGGNTYIKVSDNGCGMEKGDASVAFLRHATSKISTEEDLSAIYTLGFRGEALSSIGAVAMVDLYTKRVEDAFGTHTVCNDGEIVSEEDAGIPNGTTFIVKNLFYNVPARMKFLKKDQTEAGYISDIMTRFILARPDIAFKFINNSKTVLSSYGDTKLVNCVYSVYGKDYASAMLDVNFETEFVKVTGLCGKGSTARANRTYQSFFINGRYIKSPLIMRAVEEAYKNQIMIGKFPAAVLNLEINPALVDINVHPTKLEVKFSNENEVYQAVYHAVKNALYKIPDVPEVKLSTPAPKVSQPAFEADKVIPNAQIEIKTPPQEEKKAQTPVKMPEIKKAPIQQEITPKETYTTSIFDRGHKIVAEPKMFERNFDNLIPEKKQDDVLDNSISKRTYNTPQKEVDLTPPAPTPAEESTVKKEIPEFRVVGQVFDTYIIVEIGDEMQIIDQHAAHERLKYEEIKKEIAQRKTYSQLLAIPVLARLSAVEFAVFEQHIDFISSLGFEAEDYGNNTVIIRSVPASMIEDEISELFVEILSQLNDNKREIITAKKERLLYTIACKAAIKANHKLSDAEQNELVKMVLSLDNINTCPHGRPIIITMSKKEIEKNFKRIL